MSGVHTTSLVPAPAPAALVADRDAAAAVATSFVELQRTVRRAKARMAATGSDVESATNLLLYTVALEGSMRASALAASVQSDLSTVSRQVAALVDRGLLERRADPFDGRASLLVVTPAGQAVVAEHELARAAFFGEALNDWSPEELQQFAGQLSRFTAAYDLTHAARMSQRPRGPARPSTDSHTALQEEGSRA